MQSIIIYTSGRNSHGRMLPRIVFVDQVAVAATATDSGFQHVVLD